MLEARRRRPKSKEIRNGTSAQKDKKVARPPGRMEREKKKSTRNPDPNMYRPRGRRPGSRIGERARDEMLRTEINETLTDYRYAEVCAEKKEKETSKCIKRPKSNSTLVPAVLKTRPPLSRPFPCPATSRNA